MIVDVVVVVGGAGEEQRTNSSAGVCALVSEIQMIRSPFCMYIM
jgi:hypothetical protein